LFRRRKVAAQGPISRRVAGTSPLDAGVAETSPLAATRRRNVAREPPRVAGRRRRRSECWRCVRGTVYWIVDGPAAEDHLLGHVPLRAQLRGPPSRRWREPGGLRRHGPARAS